MTSCARSPVGPTNSSPSAAAAHAGIRAGALALVLAFGRIPAQAGHGCSPCRLALLLCQLCSDGCSALLLYQAQLRERLACCCCVCLFSFVVIASLAGCNAGGVCQLLLWRGQCATTHGAAGPGAWALPRTAVAALCIRVIAAAAARHTRPAGRAAAALTALLPFIVAVLAAAAVFLVIALAVPAGDEPAQTEREPCSRQRCTRGNILLASKVRPSLKQSRRCKTVMSSCFAGSHLSSASWCSRLKPDARSSVSMLPWIAATASCTTPVQYDS